MSYDAVRKGNVALITGGAAGIGRAAAMHFAASGMVVVIADVRETLFEGVRADLLSAGAADVMTVETDVSDRASLEALRDAVLSHQDGVDVLMNNAGVGIASDVFDSTGSWSKTLGVNLFGVTQGCQVFVPGMMARGKPAMVINTGSKQGITTPPGNPAYNLSKAGVKVYSEALAHHLREDGAPISVHLLVPGFVFTDINRGTRTEAPPSAWTPEQTVAFMVERLTSGDFYIVCPDNDVDWPLDQKRMTWAMGDITENRPPLSRWHKDWAEPFNAFVKS